MNAIEGLFEYPDMSGWQRWQEEYRYGAFFIFPPTGIIEPVDELRRRYDPRPANAAQAHVSLSEPLLGPLTQVQLNELTGVLASIQPFQVHYGPLRSFPPYPGVTYAISPEEPFIALRTAIHATSMFTSSPLSRRDIPPHMTIAEFISLEDTERLLVSLSGKVPEGDWLVDAVEYAVPDRQVHFHRVLTLFLGRRGA
jgi:2'-5' RNA ligase